MSETDEKREGWGVYSPSREPRSAGSWVGVVVTAIGLIVAAYYGHSTLKRHNLQLAQLPGLVNSLALVGSRVDNTEAKLQMWMGDRDALQKRMAALDRMVHSTLRLARKQTEELVTQAESRMEQRLDQRAGVIEARLVRSEANQDTQGAQLAKLQQEVTSVRQELTATGADTERELASLQQKQAQSQGRLETIASQLDRQRVDFEVAKGEIHELTPEVTLRVTQIDRSFQRYAGWLWYEPDRRTLWIEDQGVQQPVALRPKRGGEPYELVVTGVRKSGITGYLLVPAGASSEAKEPTAATDGNLIIPRPGS